MQAYTVKTSDRKEYIEFASDPLHADAQAKRAYRVSCGHVTVTAITHREPAGALESALFALAARVELDTVARMTAEGFTDLYNVHFGAVNVTIKAGRKYWYLDVGDSGKYMIDKVTGAVCGIKAYGVPHHGYTYGTVADQDGYFWGGYRAAPRKVAA